MKIQLLNRKRLQFRSIIDINAWSGSLIKCIEFEVHILIAFLTEQNNVIFWGF